MDIIYQNNSIREFAKYCFSYFFQNDWQKVISLTDSSPALINGVSFVSHDLDVFKRLIGAFTTIQTKASLTSGNTLRYFEEPIFIDKNTYYYFTTQWNGEGDYSLSFKNIKNYFEDNYPKFQIIRENQNYCLIIDAHDPIGKFQIKEFQMSLQSSGLQNLNKLSARFTASLLTKPFVILTGLSGSGKTKLAQAFVQWICKEKSQYHSDSSDPNDSQYCIVPVGADWTNREPLLGYPNALMPDKYEKGGSGVLDVIIRANNRPDEPHFLILDEMNLSHVERYFADFLSVMESGEPITLYAEDAIKMDVPPKLNLPPNFFIIGTVNIDETTNMFSPKVLDRANTIEFRITKDQMEGFLGSVREIKMEALAGKGEGMARSFLELAGNKEFAEDPDMNKTLIDFFEELKKIGAEFGYRSASEILRLIQNLTNVDPGLTDKQKIDIAIIQKLLPKLHGSRRKLCPILEKLGSLCTTNDIKIVKDVFENNTFDFNGANVLYPLSLEKISRMYRGAIDNGFASFAEH